MTVDFTFPCEPRFASIARDAIVAALRGTDIDEATVLSTGMAVDRFLAEHVQEPGAAPISAQITARAVTVGVRGRTLTVPLVAS